MKADFHEHKKTPKKNIQTKGEQIKIPQNQNVLPNPGIRAPLFWILPPKGVISQPVWGLSCHNSIQVLGTKQPSVVSGVYIGGCSTQAGILDRKRRLRSA